MQYVLEYLVFFAEVFTIVIALIVLIAVLKSGKNVSNKGRIKFTDMSSEYDELIETFNDEFEINVEKDKTADKKWWQFWKKNIQETEDKSRLFVVNYDGDIAASATHQLKKEINAILSIANNEDSVLIKLKSPGGVVNGYGLAAAQLDRIKKQGLPLTVAVDEVAASGGYLMASVADKIIASPFAIIGSIGVVAQLPNFHRLLEKYNIDFEQFTAGKYKRTVTMFGENTDEARDKFKEELEVIHVAFKDFVKTHRPNLDIDAIATGEHWLGTDALRLNLIDEIQTSDEYLLTRHKEQQIIAVSFEEKKSLKKSFLKMASKLQLTQF